STGRRCTSRHYARRTRRWSCRPTPGDMTGTYGRPDSSAASARSNRLAEREDLDQRAGGLPAVLDRDLERGGHVEVVAQRGRDRGARRVVPRPGGRRVELVERRGGGIELLRRVRPGLGPGPVQAEQPHRGG